MGSLALAEFLSLHQALDRVAARQPNGPRQAELIQVVWLGGTSVTEASETLGISRRQAPAIRCGQHHRVPAHRERRAAVHRAGPGHRIRPGGPMSRPAGPPLLRNDRPTWATFAVVSFATLTCVLWIDRPVALWAAGLPAAYEPALEFLTDFGYSTWYLAGFAAAGSVLFLLRRRRLAGMALFLVLAIAGSGILINVMKFFIGRGRPVALLEDGFYGLKPIATAYRYGSFPSGHSSTIASLAAALVLLYRPLIWALVPFAAIVALTRVALSHHYPSDVIFGCYCGLVAATYFHWLLRCKGVLPGGGGGG